MDERTALLLAYLDREIAGTEVIEPATDWADGYNLGRQRGLREARAFLSGLSAVPQYPTERTAEQAMAIARAAGMLP